MDRMRRTRLGSRASHKDCGFVSSPVYGWSGVLKWLVTDRDAARASCSPCGERSIAFRGYDDLCIQFHANKSGDKCICVYSEGCSPKMY